MADKNRPEDAEIAPPTGGDRDAPFRRSSSAGDYDPAGNWAAERRLDVPLDDGRPGMQGAASGAGDGGFGPEGGFSADVHANDAANGDRPSDTSRGERDAAKRNAK